MNLPAPLICKTPSSTSQVAASPRSSSLVRPSACRPTCSSRERGPPRDRRSRARHASNRGIDSLRASPLSQASRFGHVPWASQPSRNSALFAGRHTQARYHSRPQDPPIAIARNGESDRSSPTAVLRLRRPWDMRRAHAWLRKVSSRRHRSASRHPRLTTSDVTDHTPPRGKGGGQPGHDAKRPFIPPSLTTPVPPRWMSRSPAEGSRSRHIDQDYPPYYKATGGVWSIIFYYIFLLNRKETEKIWACPRARARPPTLERVRACAFARACACALVRVCLCVCVLVCVYVCACACNCGTFSHI